MVAHQVVGAQALLPRAPGCDLVPGLAHAPAGRQGQEHTLALPGLILAPHDPSTAMVALTIGVPSCGNGSCVPLTTAWDTVKNWHQQQNKRSPQPPKRAWLSPATERGNGMPR